MIRLALIAAIGLSACLASFDEHLIPNDSAATEGQPSTDGGDSPSHSTQDGAADITSHHHDSKIDLLLDVVLVQSPDSEPDAPFDTANIVDAAQTETELVVSEDASVRQGSPDKVFGDTSKLPLGYCSASANQNMRVWLKFDLSSLPAGAKVVSAEVRLYFYIHWSSQDYLIHHSADDSWSEQSITWTTQPSFDQLSLDTVTAFEQNDVWRSWRIDGATVQTAGDTLTLVLEGKTLFDSSYPDAENWAYAKEHSDANLAPRLVVWHAS